MRGKAAWILTTMWMVSVLGLAASVGAWPAPEDQGLPASGLVPPETDALILSEPVAPRSAPQDLTSADRVTINGPAYWRGQPTGPDYSGGGDLQPIPANQPSRSLLEATRQQRERFLQEEDLPENVQASMNGQVKGASRTVTDFSEVHIAVSPTDPNHLIGSSKFFYDPPNYGFMTGVFETFDGGETWAQEQPEGVEFYDLTSDPVNTFDDAGNGYFTLLTRGPGATLNGLDMMKKPAGGEWEAPTVVFRENVTDKQWIAADANLRGDSPHAGNLYMSWSQFGGGGTRILFSRSVDVNESWEPAVEIARGSVQGSVPAVASDGTVYVIYGDSIFGNAGSPGRMMWAKSEDGGRTFTTPQAAATTQAIPSRLPNSTFRSPASLPAFVASPASNNLYISWADWRNGDADVMLARSTDGGQTWDEPIRLNDDPVGNGIDQWQPQLSVAPDGRVSAIWFDRRMSCPELDWISDDNQGRENFCIDTFMARSFDEGETWEPNQRISAQTWDWTLNLPITGGGDGFIGDYQGLASSQEADFALFNSTANLGDNPDNHQQAFFVKVSAIPPANDLSPSTLEASPSAILPGGTLTATLSLSNRGIETAEAVVVTHTLPVSTSLIEGSLSSSAGQADFDDATGQITWRGSLDADGGSASLSFQLEAGAGIQDGDTIDLSAELLDGMGRRYVRKAKVVVTTPPQIITTIPSNDSQDIGPSTVLIVRFNESMDHESVHVTLDPPLEGGFDPRWSRESDSLSLRHATPFEYGQTYQIWIEGNDADGMPLIDGPVPNPWSFSIEGEPIAPAYLPWASAGGE